MFNDKSPLIKYTLTLFLLYILSVIAIVLIGISYLNFAFPNVSDAPNITVEITSESVAKGKYLANHVNVCIDCHSQRDWTLYSAPIVEGTVGSGGGVFDEKEGLPGKFVAPNITPANLGDWTDGEICRAITVGVNKDGDALFPIMPYKEYAKMDPEDVKAIIAYLRTLEPIKNEVDKSVATFPMNMIMKTIPEDTESGKRPANSDTLALGKYLTKVAGCVYCHTPHEKGKSDESKRLAGGFKFKFSNGNVVTSPNLTPHEDTGLGLWERDDFVETFIQYRDSSNIAKVDENGFNTVMPWVMYSGMKESDLNAIFRYLQSLEPIEHEVERYSKEIK
jgi:mono/diheme cytochrome c family protein